MARDSGTTSVVHSVVHVEDENTLITGEAVALDLRPTSFVLRAAGTMIDWLVYVGTYVLGLIFFITLATNSGLDQAIVQAIAVAALVVFVIIAPTVVETLTHGKSLGRLAVGARIVRDDGGAIGFRHALIRALTGFLELVMTFGGLAAASGLLNSRSKRLGDLLAGTYSQNERVSKVVPPIYGVPVQLTTWAQTADVARMPDRLQRRIGQFLRQAPSLTPESRESLARTLATEAAIYVSPVPTGSAELFLAAVTALRREREFAGLVLERERLDTLAPALTGMPHGFPSRD